jgi:DNA-binding response OmpR family regulator
MGAGMQMNPSILLIDHDPAASELLTAALRVGKFEVRTADGGQAALRSITENAPQLIIVDLSASRIDGWQICSAIRRLTTAPLLVLSVLNEPSTVARILDAGVDDYLVKPVPIAVLIAHLRKLARRTGALRLALVGHDDWSAEGELLVP